MEVRHVYLDDKAIQRADAIIESGFATSLSAAIRVALTQFSARVMAATS